MKGNVCLEPEEEGKVLNEYFTLVLMKGKDIADNGVKEEMSIF